MVTRGIMRVEGTALVEVSGIFGNVVSTLGNGMQENRR